MASLSVQGVQKEAPGVGGAVSVEVRLKAEEEVQLERKRRNEADERTAKGAVNSQLTSPPSSPRSSPLHTRAYLLFTPPTVGAIIMLRRDTQTGEITRFHSHTGAHEEKPSRHAERLPRCKTARRLARAFGEEKRGRWGAHVPTASEEPSRRRYVIGQIGCVGRVSMWVTHTRTVSVH